MTDIPEQVARNRRATRRLDGQFIRLPSTANITLSFARNEFEVSVSVEAYTRSLNNSLVSGHPAGSTHGSAAGVAGDVRGSYSAETVNVNSSVWTRAGRNAVIDALNGETTGALREIAVGTGTSAAGTGDTALANETGRTVAYGIKDSAKVVRARANFVFSEDGLGGNDATEFGLFSDGGDLLARIVTDPITVPESEELRVDISLTFSGTGVGDSVVTDKGVERIADSIRSPGTTVGLNEIALGTSDTAPTTGDSSLGNEVIRKNVTRQKRNEWIRASTTILESEPGTQPVTLREMGVYDNASPANLLWRTVFEPREKTADYKFDADVSFRVV